MLDEAQKQAILAEVGDVKKALRDDHKLHWKPGEPVLPGLVATCVCGLNSAGGPACKAMTSLMNELERSLLAHYQTHRSCDCSWALGLDVKLAKFLGKSPREKFNWEVADGAIPSQQELRPVFTGKGRGRGSKPQ